jgi:hypothetical protein
MRIKISHSRSQIEMVASVNRSFDGMLRGEAGVPIRLVLKEKSWQGSILSFTLSANLGLLNSTIKGTVEVTNQDVIVDADLGLLNRLLPENAVREVFGDRLKELLN